MTPRALDCFIERVLRDALQVTILVARGKLKKHDIPIRLQPKELEQIIRDNMKRGGQ